MNKSVCIPTFFFIYFMFILPFVSKSSRLSTHPHSIYRLLCIVDTKLSCLFFFYLAKFDETIFTIISFLRFRFRHCRRSLWKFVNLDLKMYFSFSYMPGSTREFFFPLKSFDYLSFNLTKMTHTRGTSSFSASSPNSLLPSNSTFPGRQIEY